MSVLISNRNKQRNEQQRENQEKRGEVFWSAQCKTNKRHLLRKIARAFTQNACLVRYRGANSSKVRDSVSPLALIKLRVMAIACPTALKKPVSAALVH